MLNDTDSEHFRNIRMDKNPYPWQANCTSRLDPSSLENPNSYQIIDISQFF